MREILFRGFHEYKNGTQIAVVNGKEYRGKWVGGYYSKHCGYNYISYNTSDKDFKNYIISEKVLPETVCEFTGLTDKNGKRIFEGDKVKDNRGNTGFVFYSEHFARWQIRFTSGRDDLVKYGDIGVHIFDWIYPKIELEIIGNKEEVTK